LIGKADFQKKTLHYKKTFVQLASLSTIKKILPIATAFDLEIVQLGMVATFQNGNMHAEISLQPLMAI